MKTSKQHLSFPLPKINFTQNSSTAPPLGGVGSGCVVVHTQQLVSCSCLLTLSTFSTVCFSFTFFSQFSSQGCFSLFLFLWVFFRLHPLNISCPFLNMFSQRHCRVGCCAVLGWVCWNQMCLAQSSPYLSSWRPPLQHPATSTWALAQP